MSRLDLHAARNLAQFGWNLLQNLDAAKSELQTTYRIKQNTDYALTVKYGQVHVLCHEVYEDSIKEVFERHEVAVQSVHTYS